MRPCLAGQAYSLRGPGVLSPGGQLLHPLLDDAEPAAGSGISPEGEERVASEGEELSRSGINGVGRGGIPGILSPVSRARDCSLQRVILTVVLTWAIDSNVMLCSVVPGEVLYRCHEMTPSVRKGLSFGAVGHTRASRLEESVWPAEGDTRRHPNVEGARHAGACNGILCCASKQLAITVVFGVVLGYEDEVLMTWGALQGDGYEQGRGDSVQMGEGFETLVSAFGA